MKPVTIEDLEKVWKEARNANAPTSYETSIQIGTELLKVLSDSEKSTLKGALHKRPKASSSKGVKKII